MGPIQQHLQLQRASGGLQPTGRGEPAFPGVHDFASVVFIPVCASPALILLQHEQQASWSGMTAVAFPRAPATLSASALAVQRHRPRPTGSQSVCTVSWTGQCGPFDAHALPQGCLLPVACWLSRRGGVPCMLHHRPPPAAQRPSLLNRGCVFCRSFFNCEKKGAVGIEQPCSAGEQALPQRNQVSRQQCAHWGPGRCPVCKSQPVLCWLCPCKIQTQVTCWLRGRNVCNVTQYASDAQCQAGAFSVPGTK